MKLSRRAQTRANRQHTTVVSVSGRAQNCKMKMAFKLRVQEVLERLNESETESDGEDTVAVKEEAVSGRLKKCLSRFLRRERIELGKEEDFLDSVVDAIVPLFELASASDGCSPVFLLRKAPIHAGHVLMKESRLWLERIHRRLAKTVLHSFSSMSGAKLNAFALPWDERRHRRYSVIGQSLSTRFASRLCSIANKYAMDARPTTGRNTRYVNCPLRRCGRRIVFRFLPGLTSRL